VPSRSRRRKSSGVRKDFADQQRILEDDLFQRVRGLLVGQSVAGGPKKLKAGTKITTEYLDELPREEWFEIRLEDEEANSQLEQTSERLKLQRKAFEKRLDDKRAKITAGDDLRPGRAQDGEGVSRGEAPRAAWRQDGRPVTVTRVLFPRSFRSRTCPTVPMATRSTSYSTRWACLRA